MWASRSDYMAHMSPINNSHFFLFPVIQSTCWFIHPDVVLFFCVTGCYFHSSEDSLGWHGAGLHLSDLWTFLPRGDDTREFPREENRIQLDWNLLSIFCSSSVEFSFHFGHNLVTGIEIQFFFHRAKWCYSSPKNPRHVCWSMWFDATCVCQIISGKAVTE